MDVDALSEKDGEITLLSICGKPDFVSKFDILPGFNNGNITYYVV
jgi:hypothetical protein